MKKYLLIVLFFNYSIAISQHSSQLLDSLFNIDHNLENEFKAFQTIDSYSRKTGTYNACLKFMKFKLSQKDFDSLTIARVYNLIVYHHRMINQTDSAKIYSEKGINILRAINDKEQLLVSLINSGNLYNRLGEVEKSISKYIEASKIAINLNDKANESKIYNNISVLYLNNDFKSKAIEFIKKSEEICIALKDTLGLAHVFSNYGNYYQKFGQSKYDSALGYYRKAYRTYEEKGTYRQKIRGRNNYATMLWKIGNYDESIPILLELIDEYEKTGIQNLPTYVSLMKAYYYAGDYNKAYNILERFDSSGMNFYSFGTDYEILKMAGRIYGKKGKLRKANTLLDSAIISIETNFLDGKDSLLADIETKYETEKTKRENIELLAQKQSAELKIQRRNYLLGGLACFLGVISLFSVLLYKRNRRIQHQKEELEVKNSTISLLNSEITHRVKNQFVLASELLSRQKLKAKDKSLKEIAEDSEHSLNAIAAVNKRLDASSDYKSVDVGEVIEEVLDDLNYSWGTVQGKPVRLVKDLASIKLSQDKATYLGLIINELYTNSYKYAFEDPEDPTVKVRLTTSNGSVIMMYADNGSGMKDAKKGTGTGLIERLSRQMHGQLKIEVDNGMKVKLEFPYEKQ